jgi:hypothetical protein
MRTHKIQLIKGSSTHVVARKPLIKFARSIRSVNGVVSKVIPKASAVRKARFRP